MTHLHSNEHHVTFRSAWRGHVTGRGAARADRN